MSLDAIDDKATNAGSMVKILQHLGMRACDIPDKRRAAVVAHLRQNDEVIAIALNVSSSGIDDAPNEAALIPLVETGAIEVNVGADVGGGEVV